MEKYNAVQIIKSTEDMIAKVDEMLSNDEVQDKFANNAMELVNSKTGIIDKYMAELEVYLKKL
jgi:hypothetical protein